MSESNKSNFANPDMWIRLVYMLVFAVLSGLARIIICVIAIIQFILVMLSGEGNSNLRSLGEGIAEWTRQTFMFLCFSTEQKPYPFQEWPSPVVGSNEQSEDTQENEPAAADESSASEPAASEGEEEAAVDVDTDDTDTSESTVDEKKDS